MTFQVQRLLSANCSFIGNRRIAINIILKTEDILIFLRFVGYLLLLVMMHCRIHECCPTRFTLMSFTCVSLAPPPSHLRPLTSLSCVSSDSYTPPPSVANLIIFFFFLSSDLYPQTLWSVATALAAWYISLDFVLSRSSPGISGRDGQLLACESHSLFEVVNKGGIGGCGGGAGGCLLSSFGQRRATLSLWHGPAVTESSLCSRSRNSLANKREWRREPGTRVSRSLIKHHERLSSVQTLLLWC